MRRVLFFLAALILLSPLAASAQAQQAVVKEFSGKVEVKAPGRDWRPVALNMPVAMGATVSTGFASRLVLAIGETQVSVQPLTRIVVQQLVKNGSTNTTALTLRVGKVNVAVKAASGEKNDFRIRGPASTAAVRGTEFSYDANVDDRIDAHVDSVFVTTGVTGHTLVMYPGESLNTDGIGFVFVVSPLVLPLKDLLESSLGDEGIFGSYAGSGLLPPDRLPTSDLPLATITVRVN
jgi:hypothetical protein